MKLFLTKRDDGLYSCSTDADYEASKKVAPGQSVEVKLANERIVWMHRRFFLMLKFVFENMPEQFGTLYPTQEALRKGLLVLGGHHEKVYHPDGTYTISPKSMRFDSMKQDEFEQVYSAIIDKVLKYFIDDPDLQRELIELT